MASENAEFQLVDSQQQLEELCEFLSDAESIGFDTEFVSEDRYRPELCLVQVAAKGEYAIIDPFKAKNLEPFWRLLNESQAETIVHAAREEFLFDYRATRQRPHRLFDIQMAAGLIGLEYPASYSNLVNRVLGEKLSKAETRTNWRHRPLSKQQLQYALSDVVHLHDLRSHIMERLESLNRLSWYDEEMGTWQEKLIDFEEREQWDRVSGISGLSRKKLAIVRELWRWRDELANRTDQPPRRLLRDDLLCELAKRASSDQRRISALRGMERVKRHLPDISKAIDRALSLSPDKYPKERRSNHRQSFTVIGQFLTSVLSSVCRSASIAPGIVGSNEAVKELVAHLLSDSPSDSNPALTVGWRGEIIGTTIEKVLSGRIAIAVKDPTSDQPLEFFERDE